MTYEERKTTQYILPLTHPELEPGCYDIYPAHPLPFGEIVVGYDLLTEVLLHQKVIILDGYQGVFFEEIRKSIEEIFSKKSVNINWIDISKAMKPEVEIEEMVAPYLGGDDPLFGSRANLKLVDFFDLKNLESVKTDASADINVVYGTGAALCGIRGFTIYADIPKNELQFRSRAGIVKNLGAQFSSDQKVMYKRFYFVDWVVLNRHKQNLLPRVDIVIDAQRINDITWISGNDLRNAMHSISRNIFRVRPWFEPGTWGGKWMLDHIKGLNPEVPNYAWSFELIVPENGILLEHNGILLEVSFDTLMFLEANEVQGDAFNTYDTEFPIRFDFLDTFDGGNLSVQCHPHKEYTKEHFNEDFTQEETYYILDAADDATVFLGFQEDINPQIFEEALIESYRKNLELDIERFVKKLPARKHDLFLIPPGTIHASGKNNLVLEISSTPYIFTFKMYDWLRPDLDGKPRPLNIQRGIQNLCFDRKGSRVEEELIAKPRLIEKNSDCETYHLKTHKNQLYDIHRIHLENETEVKTNGKFMVFNLVEGDRIKVTTQNGITMYFNYAETFVIPAAAESCKIVNEGNGKAILVKAFIK
jgi:mannose-6-phosphate isomerase class I